MDLGGSLLIAIVSAILGGAVAFVAGELRATREHERQTERDELTARREAERDQATRVRDDQLAAIDETRTLVLDHLAFLVARVHGRPDDPAVSRFYERTYPRADLRLIGDAALLTSYLSLAFDLGQLPPGTIEPAVVRRFGTVQNALLDAFREQRGRALRDQAVLVTGFEADAELGRRYTQHLQDLQAR